MCGANTHVTYTRLQVVERMLFVHAKLNVGLGYVQVRACIGTACLLSQLGQGMNEILGPLYYVFARAAGPWRAHAEADAFFCFATLMSDFRDMFIKTLDDSAVGISACMDVM